MSISIDSNAPYTTAFSPDLAANAVYLTATDVILGEVLAIVYRSPHSNPDKLSVILLGHHGTSGYVNMTLDASSRYFGACRGLAPSHYSSMVRRALAIAVLRTYSTMDRPLLEFLVESATQLPFQEGLHLYDEAAAGALGSAFHLLFGKLPGDVGTRVIDSGVLEAKQIHTGVVDVVYRDSDETIDQDNELVYSLGTQLEQLFNPLTEYSPEPTEQIYTPPTNSLDTLEDDPAEAQAVCEELYMVQSHLRNDLIDFHQNFLVPLRIAVLRGQIPELTIARLNSIFPPTIDEVLRINNLFYNALQTALPYGSFEVLRACGITLPYFYRALMRHEAATRDFSSAVTTQIPELQERIEQYSPQRVDSIIRSSLNLAKLKLLLDRIVASQNWPEDKVAIAEELYGVASATIDSFGRAPEPANYDRRTLTPSGKLLSEIATGWPSELEYGWMVNRRVVAIFDGIDLLESNKARQQLHHIIILFTDMLLILQPEQPIPMTSISGLRIPYVGDMLMHSLLNQVPLDHNLPPLRVLAWSPILNVFFSSFCNGRSLQINTIPDPFRIGKTNTTDKNMFDKIYRLSQPDQNANKLVEILAKTKIANKIQDLHIFRFSTDESPDLSVYATVHEINHYELEENKFPISVFINQPVDNFVLEEYGLLGAIGIKFAPDCQVRVTVVSNLNYTSEKLLNYQEYKNYVVGEICYLLTLSLSSQNSSALESITSTNLNVSRKLISWAQMPPDTHVKTHRRHPNMSRDLRRVSAMQPLDTVDEEDNNSVHTVIHKKNAASKPQASTQISSPTNDRSSGRSLPRSPNMSLQHATSEQSIPELTTPGPGPARLRKKQNFTVYRKPSGARSNRTLANRPSIASYGTVGSYESNNREDETAIIYSYGGDESEASRGDSMDNQSWVSMNSEDAEQRDVDEWFAQLDVKDDASLSTSLSDPDSNEFLNEHSRTASESSQATQEPIQIGCFLDENASNLYNMHSDTRYAPVHSREGSEASDVSFSSEYSEPHQSIGHDPTRVLDSSSSQETFSTSSHSHSLSETSQHTVRTTATGTSRMSRASEDFGWLVDYIGKAGSSDNELQVPQSTSDLGDTSAITTTNARLEFADRSVHISDSNYRLYPSLRDSSIMELSSFLRSSDTSRSLDMLANLEEPDDSRYLGSNEPTPTLPQSSPPTRSRVNSPTFQQPSPRIGRFSSNRTPRLSQTTTTPRTHHANGGVDKDIVPADVVPTDDLTPNLSRTTVEGPTEEAHPVRSVKNKDLSTPVTVNNVTSRIPDSNTFQRFQQLVAGSSLNTLQLATVSVELDDLIDKAQSPVVKRELKGIKLRMTEIYNQTHNFARNYNSSQVAAISQLIPKEKSIRAYIASMVWILISFGYLDAAGQVLEVESRRRLMLVEALGFDKPIGLWG